MIPSIRKAITAMVLITGPALGATVTIETVMTRIGVTNNPPGVPGRPAPFVFRGDNPIPSPAINDSGDIVFRARSAASFDTNNGTAFGIYAKRVGFPLAVLVDTTEVSPGVPTFPVPGRPANNRFSTSNFRAPIMNNAGDVVFQALFTSPGTTPSSGSGIYATKVIGGPIVKLIDTFDPVPGYPTATFNTFHPGLGTVALTTVLNDSAQVAFWGQFQIPGNATQRTGLFGTTVAGGAAIRLADSVGASGPFSVPVGSNGFFNEVRYVPAINNLGTVAFSAGMPGGIVNRGGIYIVSVTGGPITTVAIQGQPVPNRPGDTFSGTFEPGGHSVDINDSGVILFQNLYRAFSSPQEAGNYAATPSGGGYIHTRIYDTQSGSGISIPTEPSGTFEPAGAEFCGIQTPGINEDGIVAPFAFIFPGSPTPNQQGIYYTDTDGTPMGLVANQLTPPPGQPAPVGGFPRFSGLSQSNGGRGAINDLGNVSFVAVGNVSASVGFRGLYFYDVCTPELVRISDSTISTSQLGGFVVNGYDIYQAEATSGMYRSINNLNDVAFAAQFSNFDYGLYIAHIDVGGGGQLAIACPSDVAAQCPAETNTSSAGVATASGCGDITVTFTDSNMPGCGGTENIARTWTADNSSTTASCVQVITEADTTGPVLSGAPNDATAQCNDLPAAAMVTALDACQGGLPVSLTEMQVPGSCPGTYVLTRTWTATDGCGNSTSTSQDVAVMDTLDPLLVGVPADVSVECEAVPDPPTVTASDTCDTDIPVTFTQSQTNGSCPDEYTLTRSWTAVDDCLNDVTAVQFVSVDDTKPPTITCPAHTALECPADTSPAANGSAAGVDNCGDTTISSSDATQFGCGGTQAVTRTWTATDDCGNTSSCLQFVSVVDTTPPVLSGVPVDASAECDAVPAPASPTASDACDGETPVTYAETRADGSCADKYTLTRTWTATDACTNSAAASQTVSVDDATPPVVTCPANATLECPADTGVAANGTATATDNCGTPTPVSSDSTAPGCGATVTVSRTWTATDECGLLGSCNQVVSTVDTTPPTIQVDATPMVVTDADCSGSECVVLPIGTASDGCDSAVTVAHNAPTCGPLDAPAPDNDDDDGDHDADDDGHHDDDDDDDDDDVPSGPCNGFCIPTGESTVTYSATDACGNLATVSLPVTVRYGADIAVRVERHTVHHGHHPHSTKSPLADILACAYDKSNGSCAKTICGGTSHHHYECILDECDPVGCCTTGSDGRCTINVPPDDYLVLADDLTGEVLPDPLGTTVSDLDCGETKNAYLKQIIDAHGKKKPCKTWRLTGSELLIIEPEFVLWDETEQLYPFVFETIGDWTVTATVAPPDGFVADYQALDAEVQSEIEAVQFTITEVGSDLVPTQTVFHAVHNGTVRTVHSNVGILLTPEYARSRGFEVEQLESQGLIVQSAGRLRPAKPARRPSGR